LRSRANNKTNQPTSSASVDIAKSQNSNQNKQVRLPLGVQQISGAAVNTAVLQAQQHQTRKTIQELGNSRVSDNFNLTIMHGNRKRDRQFKRYLNISVYMLVD